MFDACLCHSASGIGGKRPANGGLAIASSVHSGFSPSKFSSTVRFLFALRSFPRKGNAFASFDDQGCCGAA